MPTSYIDSLISQQNKQLDWISFRAVQSYPFADQATVETSIGTKIPRDLFLDLRLLMPSQVDTNISNNFFISKVQERGSGYAVIISFYTQTQPEAIQCCICQGIPKDITQTTPLADRTFPVQPVTQTQETLQAYPWMNRISGQLCMGNTATYTMGSINLVYASGKLNPMCILFLGGDHLQAIQVEGNYLTGVVNFQAGQGIQFSVNGNTIQVSVDNNYLNERWQQLLNQYTTSQQGQTLISPIRTINGKPPINGNITIQGLDCVRVTGVDHGITISNPCAKPCCNQSAALQGMQANIKILESEQRILRDYYVNMSNVVNYMQINLSTLMSQYT